MNLIAFGQPGITELLIVLALLLLFFGAKRLPELSRSLGKSLSEFKKGREEGLKAVDEPEKIAPAPEVAKEVAETKEAVDATKEA